MLEHCTDKTVHLFSTETPPVSGQGMAPMIVKSHDDVITHDSEVETVECNIPCKQEKGMEGHTRFIDGEKWTIVVTMEDGATHSYAKIDRIDYRQSAFFSTQSFQSSVPLTVFDFKKHNLRNRPAVDWETAKNKGVYLVDSNCASQSTRRHKYYAATHKVNPVDAYGTCHHNTNVTDGMTMETPEGRIAIMKQYRMVLAFDGTSEKDYISSYIWEALASGALPVVVGAANMGEILPPHSFIWAGDYGSWDDLAVYIKNVTVDKELWESYHTWRTDETALADLEAKFEFTRANPTCRLCRWAYAKKYGLGWSHKKQEVKDLKLARKLCTSSSKSLASKPFQEEWVAKLENDEDILQEDYDATETCDSMTSDETMHAGSFEVHRTLIQHDGVTDIIISGVNSDKAESEIVLRLHFPGVRNSDGAHFRNTHTLVPTTRGALVSSASFQDEFSKVTFLADWVTTISSPHEGIIEVVIQTANEGPSGKDLPKRIRVIIEDMSEIHDKMTEFFHSAFGKQMTQDFVDPLEIFFSDS
jgi:hypothetical protein